MTDPLTIRARTIANIEGASFTGSCLEAAEDAVEEWLTSVGSNSRAEEADHLQDLAARLLAALLEATAHAT